MALIVDSPWSIFLTVNLLPLTRLNRIYSDASTAKNVTFSALKMSFVI